MTSSQNGRFPHPATANHQHHRAATNDRINETEEYNFQQWARFDAIYPIYAPEFETASSVNLRDDELVMGVTLGGEAKAYPVTTMQFREMVNDELGGIPILVTW